MKSIFYAFFFSFTLAVFAENPIQNADFRMGSDIQPQNWTLKTPGTGKRILLPDGKTALELSGSAPGENQWWMQSSLAVLPDKIYRVEVEAKGEPSLTLLAYIERNKPVFRGFSSPRILANGSWQKLVFEFKYDGPGAPPYLVLRSIGRGKSLWHNPLIRYIGGEFVNGNFSKGASGWKLDNYSRVENGKLILHNPAGKAQSFHSDIRVKGKQPYLLSWRVKGSANNRLTDSMHATWWRVYPRIEGKIPAGAEIWRDCFDNFQQKKLVFTPENDGMIDLVCELKSGEVTFDDINLEPTSAKLESVEFFFDPPHAFRQASYSSMEGKEFSGQVKINTPGVRSIKITFNGQVSETKKTTENCHFAFPVPAKTGTYPFVVSAFNDTGNELVRKETSFTVYPPGPREITFRADGVMLINGSPFFPIGAWGVHGSKSLDEKACDFARAGFNLWLAGVDNLDVAEKHGLFMFGTVVERLPEFVKSNRDKLNIWKKMYASEMGKVCKHPALLGYFISDEPAWRGIQPEPIQEAYELIQSIDPYKPVLLNEAPRGKIDDLRAYLGCFDLYGVDIYPFPSPNNHSDLTDKMMTSVGKYTDRCREVVFDRKPVWMTLQGFAWGALNGREAIYPTHEDNRFMAYDAIVHGAKGLLWWGINCKVDAPEFLELLGKTAREVNTLAGVIVSQEKTPEFKVNHPELRSMSRRYNGRNYHIVANESADLVNAEFTGSLPEKLHVLFENRSLDRKNNSVKDIFKPYTVHIYSDSAELPVPLPKPELKGSAAKVDYGTLYQNASWIWFPGKNKVPGHRAFFRKTVEIPGPVKRAQIFITADDFYRFKLNGKLSGDQTGGITRNWMIIDRYDLTRDLKQGKNLFEFQAMDGKNPPCGLLVLLEVELASGKKLISPSDNSFESSEDGRNWKKAEVVARFDQSPWGNALRVQNNDNSTLGMLDFQP